MKEILFKLGRWIMQSNCKHHYKWQFSSGGDVKKYHDDYSVGICEKCNHKIYEE